MKTITLGSTGITTPQNAFGALPIQRIGTAEAVEMVRRAYEGGMRFFDTARAYSDSEEKLGIAFEGMRDKVFIATKTMAKTPEAFWRDLETSLALLKTDHVDIYQFHNALQMYKPGDGTGMHECMLEAKAQGKIKHIGITTHSVDCAYEVAESGLYETLQYPFSYLSIEHELALPALCAENRVGFIAMKALGGGLLNNSKAIMAFISQYEVLPIWGIQRTSELEEWLSFMDETPEYDEAAKLVIEADRAQLADGFCRSCGYCAPCPKDIKIFQLARMNMLLRRMPSAGWLSEKWQAEMRKVEDCTECRVCQQRCPYSLDVPRLLKENYADYFGALAGTVDIS